MAGILRVDLVNYSDSEKVTVQVASDEAIKYRELLGTTPANDPGSLIATVEPVNGIVSLDVAPGRFFGFLANSPAQISNPAPQLVTVIYTFGKDPWPQPPPAAPQTLAGRADFKTRYTNFNLVSGTPDPVPTQVYMTLAREDG